MAGRVTEGRTAPAPITLRCSFCGRHESATGTLIAGHAAAICRACVADCASIIQHDPATAGITVSPPPAPAQLKAHLDEHVIGQEHAKRVLAVAVHNHFKRLLGTRAPGGPELTKSNVLLIGPSGTGKTLLAETLARRLDLPFVVCDATTLTEAGYVGEDVESIAERLLAAADGDAARAARGIVFLDEVDKLAGRGRTPTHGRDVSGEGVQQGLLRILEGQRIALRGKRGGREPVEVDTREVLFIAGGAFDGLSHRMQDRRRARGVGFLAAADAGAVAALTPEPDDLIDYGLIPEFVGRLPVVAMLEPLREADLLAILTRPRHALLRQYETLFAMEGCSLRVSEDALRAVAREALARGTAARGLRAIMERLLLEAMFSVPSEPRGVVRIEAHDVAARRALR
jgi:ATP-dependent Clp protease ATP-binding subunit ClpX